MDWCPSLFFLVALFCVTGIQSASLHGRSRCRVDDIKLKENFDAKKFAGKWYDVGRIDTAQRSNDLASGYSQFIFTDDGRMEMHYVGEIEGECQSPFTGVSETYWGPRLFFTFPQHSFGPLSGPYWVVDTDYKNFAIIYGCYDQEADGSCAEDYGMVYVLARQKGIRPQQRMRLEYMLEQQLCVDVTKMRYIKHSVECPASQPKSLWNMWGMLDDDTDVDADPAAAVQTEDENAVMQEEVVEDNQVDAPAVCKFEDIPIAATFDEEKILGRWFILATHREKIDGSRSDGVYELSIDDNGYLEMYFTGAHNGVCLPTFYGVGRPTDVKGQYTVQNERQDGPLKFAYLTSDMQYGVTYQCTDLQDDGTCGQVTVDVFGRTKEFPEEVKAELRPVVETYCVKPTDFTTILQDVGCELDLLEDEPTCLVDDIKAAQNVDWTKQIGTWYAVAAYKDKEAPSLTFFLQSEVAADGTTSYYNWVGYASNGECMEPNKADASVTGSSGDISLTAGGKTRSGKLILTDNSRLNMFYECGRVLQDGTCDPSFTRLHVSMRSRTAGKHVIRALKVILKRLCIQLEDVQVVDHTVPCEADPDLYVAKPPVPENLPEEIPVPENLPEEIPVPENLPAEDVPVPENLPEEIPVPENPIAKQPVPENLPEVETPDAGQNSVEQNNIVKNDDKCAFVNIQSQDDFDPAKFEGLWYHIYRLKSSHHEFESETNYIEDLQNGQMTAHGKHYHDGHCSEIQSTTYTKSKKMAGDWTFGTYGGVKILYTDYNYAVVYVCDEVSKDGSCDQDQVEVEVMSRNKDTVPDDVKDTLLAVIEGVCLSKDDFEEITQTFECPLFKIQCPIAEIPEQADFNAEKFTGTWQHIADIERNAKISSVSVRFTKTDKGYHSDIRIKLDGKCVVMDYDWEYEAGTAKMVESVGTGLLKVLYTDYESALLYVCHKVHNDHCVPSNELVLVLGRTSFLTDSQIIDMVEVVPDTCFTKDDFKYLPEEEPCPITLPVVKLADLPKAEDYNVEKFVGRWYGQYHLREHGDWEDGVIDYELLEDGSLKVTGTGSDGENCLDSVSYLSFPTAEVYEWTVMAGGNSIYVRLLDVNPENHAIIYVCGNILDDGSCDPDRTYIDVLTRTRDDLDEQVRAHLRDVLRKAGFAPGDFVKAYNAGLECEAVHYPDFSCNVNDLVGMDDVDLRKMSGTWYIVAKLNGTDVLGSEWTVMEYVNDSTFILRDVGHRHRRGCDLPTSITIKRDKARYEAVLGELVVKGMVLWTDYENMMVYDCFNVLDDGSCASGAQRGIILSRRPGKIPEDAIAQMDSIADQPCANRENYQWVEHTVHCPMNLHRPDSCKPENIEAVADIKPDVVKGTWYVTYMLRQELSRVKLSSMMYDWTFGDDGIITSKFSVKVQGQCTASTVYLHPTDTPGVYKANYGHLVQTFKVVYADEDNMVLYQCVKVGADGFCEENEDGVMVHSRNVGQPSEEVLEKARALAKKLCFQPGDFVRLEHKDDYCPLADDPVPFACSVDEMPIKEDFEVDRFTGTWYAVANLKGHAIMPSSVSRVVKEADGSFSIVSTGLQPRGGCRHATKAKVVPDDDLSPGDVYLETVGGKRRLRILYTDYAFALAYQCLHYQADGTCRIGSELVTAYARTPHLPDDAIQRMLPAAEKACFTRNDFEMVPQTVLCSFDDYDPMSCRVRDIPTQDNFQLDRFMGTWYSHFKFPSDWDTFVSVYEKNDDGTVTMHFSGELNGECAEPMKLTMSVSKGNPAVMYSKRNGQLYGAKIVHTDYVTNAVVYGCGQVLDDGTCARDKVYIQVLGRSLDKIPEEEREHLKDAVRDTCFETGDFMQTTHTRNCEPFREIDCPVQDLPVQDNFDMNKFTGKWNAVARLRNSGQLESGVIGIKFNKPGEYLAYMTGAVAGKCQSTVALTLHPNYKGQPADMHVEYGNREGFLRVLYTDYEHALVYICEEIRADGRCVPSKLKLVALTRGEMISNDDLITMARVAKKACFTADQFEWINRDVHCTLDVELMDECKPANLVTAGGVTLDLIKGTWFLRYTLRGRLQHDSVVYNFEALENGDLRYEATAALDGKCVDTTVVSLAYQTDDAAIWRLNSHRIGEVEGQIKVLYLDEEFAVIYECDKEDDEGFCFWDKIQVSVLSRNKDALTEAKSTELIEVARAACLEPGMFTEVQHPVDCPLSDLTPYTCAGGDLPSVEDFSMEKMTGTWYAVARLKGSPVPNSFVSRISLLDDNTYQSQFRGARRGRCIETATSQIVQADDGSSTFHIVKDEEKLTVSQIAFTNYEVALIKGCLLLQPDGSCAQGHEQVAVYARSPEIPAEDVIAEMEAAGHQLCVDRSLFESVRHDLPCPIDTPIDERCLEANIKAQEDFSLDNMTGMWYTLYRLRDTGNMDFGTTQLTKVDDHHIKGEFAFSVGGQCVSAEAMYHHVRGPGKPSTGEFYTNIGRFQASVKIVAANSDYMLLYECENVDPSGVCSSGGRFVGVFGRSPEAPPPEILVKLRQLVRDVCLEPGDFVATEHTGECEVKIEKASLNCPVSELPSKEDHVYNKDMGTWYGVAKLKGSNFLNSHIERGVFDEKNQVYRFYFAGERARGGCTPTGTTEIGLQELGDNSGTVSLTTGEHRGMWKILYNDYKYSLYYECSHMLDKDTCAPGYESIAAYSRRREKIPEHMIVKMFENIPQNCFTREDFEWIPQTTDCPLEFDYPDCRVRQIPVIENLDIDQVLGTWYSRYLLTAHAAFDSYSVRYEKTDEGLRGHYSGTKMGQCQRSIHLDIEVPNSGRGVWHRLKNGKRVVIKVMWTDYKYSAVYTCDEVLDDDSCAPNKDYIDVLARDLEPIPVTVIERLKRVLKRACYEPGDLVESDHDVGCEEDTCSVAGVKMQKDFKVSDVLGDWQLIHRTTHLNLDRGPSTMRIMRGSGENAMLSLARLHDHGCNTYQSMMFAQGEATFSYSFSGLPGLLKIIHASDEHLLVYECFGVELVDGYCPPENEEIQGWDRVYHNPDDHKADVENMATDTTCVDPSNLVSLAQNTDCKVPDACKLDDFVAQEDLDPRSLLGSWVLRTRTSFHEAVYNSNHLKFAYSSSGVGTYSISGDSASTGQCISHFGTVEQLEGDLYQFEWDGQHALGKFLFVNDNGFVLLECLGDLEFGECPLEKTLLSGYARDYEPMKNPDLVKKEIKERTHGCFDFAGNVLEFQEKGNDCEEPEDPEGKLSCTVEGMVPQKDLDPKDLEGAWFLIARTGMIDLSWDAGVLHAAALDDGVIELKYTGLVSYDTDECLQVFTESMTPTDEPGHFGLVTERLGGLNSIAKILYADEDHFIWYECQGSRFTSAGACQRQSEHIEVFSRRRKLNSADKQKLVDKVKDATCVDLDTFVMANHTKRCELPGITDQDIPQKSCSLEDYPTQANFDPEQFAGLWYEIERTRYASDNIWESGLTHFEHEGDNLMTFSYTGSRDGVCSGPFTAYVRPAADDPADLIMYIGNKDLIGSPWTVSFKYKVIYTDYQVAITHACLIWNPDGTCRHPGEQVDILSRTPDLDSKRRSELYDIIRQNLCVDVYDLVEPAQEESCHMKLGLEVPVDCSKRPMCAMYCENGFVTGQDGCPICECKELDILEDSSGEGSGEEAEEIVDSCPLMMCMIECEFGFQTDENGCDMCACNDKAAGSCPPMMCMIECEFGFQTDEDGCDKCACNEKAAESCPPMMCMIECEFGFQTDEDGCDKCACNESPVEEAVAANELEEKVEEEEEAELEVEEANAVQGKEESVIDMMESLFDWLN